MRGFSTLEKRTEYVLESCSCCVRVYVLFCLLFHSVNVGELVRRMAETQNRREFCFVELHPCLVLLEVVCGLD